MKSESISTRSDYREGNFVAKRQSIFLVNIIYLWIIYLWIIHL